MTLGIHTNTCTTQYSLQSFFIHNENIAVLQWQQLFNPTLTSLERRRLCFIYNKNWKPSPRGCNSQGERDCSCRWSQSELDLSLSESDLSLTECNYQLESWSDWHLNLLTATSTKTHPDGPTCVEERKRVQFPILHVVVHSQFSLDHLLLLRNGQLQSIQSQWDWFQSNRSKIHWFKNLDFLHYLINLSIK